MFYFVFQYFINISNTSNIADLKNATDVRIINYNDLKSSEDLCKIVSSDLNFHKNYAFKNLKIQKNLRHKRTINPSTMELENDSNLNPLSNRAKIVEVINLNEYRRNDIAYAQKLKFLIDTILPNSSCLDLDKIYRPTDEDLSEIERLREMIILKAKMSYFEIQNINFKNMIEEILKQLKIENLDEDKRDDLENAKENIVMQYDENLAKINLSKIEFDNIFNEQLNLYTNAVYIQNYCVNDAI